MFKDDVIIKNLSSQFEEFSKSLRTTSYLCCWHMNEHESAAMWKLYLSSNEGIAIQTNVDRLIKSFDLEVKEIYIGVVRYIDYMNEYLPEDNALNLLLHKRKSFEHENELRCVYSEFMCENNNVFGKDINVNLNELIEKIYIAPHAPDYLKVVLEDVVNKFGFNFEVIQSNMYKCL